MKKDEYQCASCGKVFKKGWSDDEAMEEANETWPDEEDFAIVCDNCYKKMIGYSIGQSL